MQIWFIIFLLFVFFFLIDCIILEYFEAFGEAVQVLAVCYYNNFQKFWSVHWYQC